MRLLGVRPGMTIAISAAGSGSLTVRLSPSFGRKAASSRKTSNPHISKIWVKRVKAPSLRTSPSALAGARPAASRGLRRVAILVHMYHEISYPTLCSTTRTDAQGAAVRWALSTRVRQRPDTAPSALLACELAAVGYRQIV